MTNEEKLNTLEKKEKEIEKEIDKTKSPHHYAGLASELSALRYKIESVKLRMKQYRERPTSFECNANLREY